MQQIAQALHNARHAACIPHVGGGPPARRANVQQPPRPAVHAVKHIAVQLYAVLVCDGRQVQHRIGGAGNGGMDEDGVFKCLFCHDISRADARARQRYRLFARAPRIVCQQRACGRNKRAARKRKPQGLGHHLHRARRAHKAACSAGRAGMGLIKPELLRGDLAALILGAVCTDLLQRQQIRPRIHHTAGHKYARRVQPAGGHQIRGQALITACNVYRCVKRRGHTVDLDGIRNDLPRSERVIDAVVSLRHAVAYICSKVARRVPARAAYSRSGGFHQTQQVRAAGMAVAKCALHHYLRFFQVGLRLPHTHAQRVDLRRKRPHLLADHFLHSLHSF